MFPLYYKKVIPFISYSFPNIFHFFLPLNHAKVCLPVRSLPPAGIYALYGRQQKPPFMAREAERMPSFRYSSKDMKGQTFRGTIEAESLAGFYRQLKERGQFCVGVSAKGDVKNLTFGSGKVKLKALTVFCRQFSTMLDAGLPIIKSLDVLYEQTEDRRMKAVILGVYEAVEHGESLSHAMQMQKNAFPLLMLNMVEAGEVGGTLEQVMKRLADQFEKENRLQNKVRQAMIYPIFLVVTSILVVTILLTFVMPTFLTLYQQTSSKMPTSTKILLAISSSFTKGWYVYVLVIIGIVVGFRSMMKNPQGHMAWDHFVLHLPVVGKLVLTVQSAQFARTLSSLFSSGLPIIQSLEIVENVIGNHVLKQGIRDVREAVRRGVPLSVSMRRLNLFPPMLCSMLNVGEESGNMDDILAKTATFYDEEAEAAIQRMVNMLEPIMIVVLGIIVGFIVISIITPIYSLYGQISNNNGAGLQ